MNARDVVEYLLRLSDTEANDITNLKLQKLVYYVQGFHLAMYGEPVFNEPIEAWQYGPVVRELYNTYKGQGNAIIPPAEDYDFSGPVEGRMQELMQEINEVYGQFSGIKLMHMTHEERPWLEAQELNRSEISKDTMKAYFSQLVTS